MVQTAQPERAFIDGVWVTLEELTARIRNGVHYIIDQEPDDSEEGYPDFADCTPTDRAVGCGLCGLVADGTISKVESREVSLTYEVVSLDDDDGVIVFLRQDALERIGVLLDRAELESDVLTVRIARRWMLDGDAYFLPD